MSTPEDTLRALPVVWDGEPVALALSGYVFRGTFYGRTMSFRGWTDVSMPFSEFRNVLTQTETQDLCPTITSQSS